MDEKIKCWKQQYGRIFRVKIQGQYYIYRTLNIRECDRVFSLLRQNKTVEAEDVALNAVLFPDGFNPGKTPIQLTRLLADFVLEFSDIFKPDGLKSVLEIARNNLNQFMQDDFSQWKLAILSIFPGYTLSTLNAMSVQEFFNLLVLAEDYSGKKLINYKKMDKESKISKNTAQQKIQRDADGMIPMEKGQKFAPQEQLIELAKDEATQNLREHWSKFKKGK